jgi:alkanesulfonate monooxygenase SsuD/methylene tetrahydromethanopterin reductase-like flavin-dependent oxidoreductase (luciferase family)
MKISYLAFWTTNDGESHAQAYDASFEEIRVLDEAGWDTVWSGGVPLRTMVPDTLLLAAAIAARTSRIKIGTAVHLPGLKAPGEEFTTDVKAGGSPINRRGGNAEKFGWVFDHFTQANPLQTAEQIAMLDQLSNGRFIYGAGGDTTGDERRQRHLHEYLAVMRQVWTEDEFSGFQGEFYNYPPLPDGAHFQPKCVQQPHPPILLPLDSQQGFVPMGKLGYQIAIGGGGLHNVRGDAVLKDDVMNYRQAWLDAGHPGVPSVAIRMNTHVAATQREADRVREASQRTRVEHTLKRERSAEEPERSSDLFGTPEEIVDRIHQLREDFGADEIICTMLGWSGSREDVLRSIRLISEKVIPEISSV